MEGLQNHRTGTNLSLSVLGLPFDFQHRKKYVITTKIFEMHGAGNFFEGDYFDSL